MFEKHGCNMTNRESYIRAFIASLVLIYAFISSSFILGLVSLLIFYTAYKKFCFVYFIFRINERFSQNNYYLSLLPKYRSTPVFIFNEDGKIVFANKLAKTTFPHVGSMKDLSIENHSHVIETEGAYYKVEIVPIKTEKLILAYFTDVSEVMQLNDEIEETQREVIYAMGEIGETRSKETGNHVKRVALYSQKLALLYGLSYEKANILHMASPMHDIGKVGIPDAILNAPRKLTLEEFKIMKTHAELGYNMLKHSSKPILQAAAIVANEHHEKWDGSGYPNATKGEEIHIYGRITAVADVFDALGSERVYKKAWELEKILELFKEESGKHFDPKIVTLFMENLNDFLEIRDKFKDEIL
jgi:response regulator RpfG family c-di-GMP phosphodiesterase